MWTFLNGKWVFAPETGSGSGPDDSEEGTEEVEELEEGTEESEEGTEEVEELEEGTEEGEASQSRKISRVQRLANEAKEARERAIRAEAERDILKQNNTRQPPVDNAVAERRAERMALMTPEEKREFLAKEETESLKQDLNLTKVQMADFRDEARYDAVAGLDTVKGRTYAKHKAWVEETLARERAQGRNPSRELLIRIKLGDDTLNAKPSKSLNNKKIAAAERVTASKGKAGSIKGGASSSSSKDESLETLRARILEREARGEAG